MVKPFLLYFLLAQRLWAQDCQGLSDGEVLRLDKESKSLGTFKTQDQDGLGTCASNATSLLLHSVLPDNPDVSYLHLASIYKRQELNTKRQEQLKSNGPFDVYAKKTESSTAALNPNREESEKWDLGIDAATVCGIIDSVKDYQRSSPQEGVCKKDRMNLEKNIGGDDKNWLQRKSVLAVSQYMNQFQKNFSEALTVKENPNHGKLLNLLSQKKYTESEVRKNADARKKYQDFKSSFEELLNNKDMANVGPCQKLSADVFSPLNQKMAQYFFRHDYCFDGTHPDYPMCKIFNKFMSVQNLPRGGRNADFKPGYTDVLLKYVPGGAGVADLPMLRKKMFTSLETINGAPFTNYEKNEINLGLDEIDKDTAERALNEINEIKNLGYSNSCRERRMMDYLQSKSFLEDVQNDQVLCQSKSILEHVGSVISSTAMSGISDLTKVKDFLLNTANLNLDEAIISLYAYDCEARDKVRLPENMSCSETVLSSTPKEEVNQKIIQEIRSDRALTASICAAILEKPKNEFRENECGHHAVGVIGVKCEAGKMKYLIQNSWGINSKAKNRAIENEMDGLGSYWFDETSFFDGVSRLQSVGR